MALMSSKSITFHTPLTTPEAAKELSKIVLPSGSSFGFIWQPVKSLLEGEVTKKGFRLHVPIHNVLMITAIMDGKFTPANGGTLVEAHTDIHWSTIAYSLGLILYCVAIFSVVVYLGFMIMSIVVFMQLVIWFIIIWYRFEREKKRIEDVVSTFFRDRSVVISTLHTKISDS